MTGDTSNHRDIEATRHSEIDLRSPVFLDFEASSLGKRGYPIEVAWISADGTSECHLIKPAPDWDDWDDKAEAIHGIARETLERDGSAHDAVARRMVEDLAGLGLFASAPSWDGKWLSVLLRAADLPRHALRLRDSDEALAAAARDRLAALIAGDRLHQEIQQIMTLADVRDDEVPAHRALPDAQRERDRWLAVCKAAGALADALRGHGNPL